MMTSDYFPLTIKDSINTIMCYGTLESIPKKEGYDKKTTIYGKKIISYTVKGISTTVSIVYIEKLELDKLETMWDSNAIITIISDNGVIYRGILTDETFNFKQSLDTANGVYYYSGTINMEV